MNDHGFIMSIFYAIKNWIFGVNYKCKEKDSLVCIVRDMLHL